MSTSVTAALIALRAVVLFLCSLWWFRERLF